VTVFAKAWNSLKQSIEEKNSWGKNELKMLMLMYDCLHTAATENDRGEDAYNDLQAWLEYVQIVDSVDSQV